MGRPKMLPDDHGRYQIRCSPQDRSAWDAAAAKDGLPLSEWIRAALAAAAGGRAKVSVASLRVDTAYRRSK